MKAWTTEDLHWEEETLITEAEILTVYEANIILIYFFIIKLIIYITHKSLKSPTVYSIEMACLLYLQSNTKTIIVHT